MINKKKYKQDTLAEEKRIKQELDVYMDILVFGNYIKGKDIAKTAIEMHELKKELVTALPKKKRKYEKTGKYKKNREAIRQGVKKDEENKNK